MLVRMAADGYHQVRPLEHPGGKLSGILTRDVDARLRHDGDGQGVLTMGLYARRARYRDALPNPRPFASDRNCLLIARLAAFAHRFWDWRRILGQVEVVSF